MQFFNRWFNCNHWKSVWRRKDTQITDFKGRGKWIQPEARAFSECFAFLRSQILTHCHDRPYLPPPYICPTSLWLATPGDSQFPQYHAFPWLPICYFLICKNFPFPLPGAFLILHIVALRLPFGSFRRLPRTLRQTELSAFSSVPPWNIAQVEHFLYHLVNMSFLVMVHFKDNKYCITHVCVYLVRF